ncbi:MAG: hypothetical protein HYZ09_02635 [Candidatus Kerfeldbacteria bacterium]|nr:hypothetical protein [Candidatus Kerfeldbacteria bacterium]
MLEHRPVEFFRTVRLLRRLTRDIHLDLMDGTLVPGRTVPPATLVRLPPGGQYQLHLMVRDPLPWLAVAERIRARSLIIHLEIPRALERIRQARRHGFQTWVAINPDTPLSRLTRRIAADGIMVMGVAPGAQGQAQTPHLLQRLRALRRRGLPLGVDGGVRLERLAALAAAGVSTFVVGAGITLAGDPARAYAAFQRRLRDA